MDLIGSKIAVLIIFGLLKFLSGLAPSFILRRLTAHKKRQRLIEKVMGGVLCIGGGVLLATVFVHMLPEVRESLNTAKEQSEEKDHDHEHEHEHDHHEEGHHGYPFAELITCAGFFLIFWVEATVHRMFIGKHSHGHSHTIPPGMLRKNSISDEESQDIGKNSEFKDKEKKGISSPNLSSSSDSGVDNESFDHESENIDNKQTKDFTQSIINEKQLQSKNDTTNITLMSYKTDYGTGKERSLSNTSPEIQNHETISVSNNHKSQKDKEEKILFSLRNFLIVLALSVHSIFEGMAIGLQLSVPDVWKLFLAIALHAIPVHFCVGMEMFNGGMRKLHIIIYFIVLAIVTPIGIIIGMVITEHAGEGNDETKTLVIGILQGLAGGTLLYITFYEVLDREKLSRAGMTGFLGCFLLTCGFAFMAGLEAVGGHSHGVTQKDHNHESHSSLNSHMAHHGHDHNHGDIELETSSRLLSQGIKKYSEKHHSHKHEESHTHDHNDHHAADSVTHSDDHDHFHSENHAHHGEQTNHIDGEEHDHDGHKHHDQENPDHEDHDHNHSIDGHNKHQDNDYGDHVDDHDHSNHIDVHTEGHSHNDDSHIGENNHEHHIDGSKDPHTHDDDDHDTDHDHKHHIDEHKERHDHAEHVDDHDYDDPADRHTEQHDHSDHSQEHDHEHDIEDPKKQHIQDHENHAEDHDHEHHIDENKELHEHSHGNHNEKHNHEEHADEKNDPQTQEIENHVEDHDHEHHTASHKEDIDHDSHVEDQDHEHHTDADTE